MGDPGAAAVLARPTGEVTPWARKRYQWAVAGARPVASTCTVWSTSALVVVVPLPTMDASPGSVAISHSTSTGPLVVVEAGETRVHSTTRSASGSPEATPCS